MARTLYRYSHVPEPHSLSRGFCWQLFCTTCQRKPLAVAGRKVGQEVHVSEVVSGARQPSWHVFFGMWVLAVIRWSGNSWKVGIGCALLGLQGEYWL